MKKENIKVVEEYLNALKHKNLSLAPLAGDLLFENPVSGRGRGSENFHAFLSGFLPSINDIRVLQHVSEGDTVVTHWEADTIFGIISILEKFRIREGQIVETYGFFDPRPIFGGK